MALDTAVITYLVVNVVGGYCVDKAKGKLSEWGSELKKRLNAGKLPKNYDLELSIRSASLKASRGFLNNLKETESTQKIWIRRRNDISNFVDAADEFLKQEQKRLAQNRDWFTNLPDSIPNNYSSQIMNSVLSDSSTVGEELTDLEILADLILKGIVDGINSNLTGDERIDCPEDIKVAFLNTGEGWPAAFRACIIDELVEDGRLEKINSAYQLAVIGAEIDELRQILQHGLGPEFISSILDMQKTVKNIDSKTDVILDRVEAFEEKLDRLRPTVEIGQGPQDWDVFLKKHNLTLVQISRLAQQLGFSQKVEQLENKEAKFIQSWFDLSINSIKLLESSGEENEGIFEQSVEAFRKGRLEEADALLEKINSDEEGYLKNRQRSRSEKLAFQAQIVVGLRDVRRAKVLYDAAFSCLPQEDNQAKYNVLMGGAGLFYGLGLIERTLDALYFAKEFIDKILRECAPKEKSLDLVPLYLIQGDILSALGEAERGATGKGYLFDAVNAFLCAEEVLKENNVDTYLSEIFNAVGSVYLKLGDRLSSNEKVVQYGNAMSSFENALRPLEKSRSIPLWASIKINQGMLYNKCLRIGNPVEEAEKLFRKSKEAYNDAATFYTLETYPVEWSIIKNNIGLLLCDIARFPGNSQALEVIDQAIYEFKNALKVRNRDLFPQKWAMTIQNLGLAYLNKAEISVGCRKIISFKRAVKSFSAALEVRTKNGFPQYWAQTQSNLGRALHGLGCVLENQDKKRNHYFDAKKAIESSLQIRTKEHLPFDWEHSQMQLVHILAQLGDEFNDISYFNRAKGLLNELHTYYHAAGNTFWGTICAQKQNEIDKSIAYILQK